MTRERGVSVGRIREKESDEHRERKRKEEEGREGDDRSTMLIGFCAPLILYLFRGCREFLQVYANVFRDDNSRFAAFTLLSIVRVFILCIPALYSLYWGDA